MVKDTLSTREVVADHENCSDESHISKAQEFSAIWRMSASGALEVFK